MKKIRNQEELRINLGLPTRNRKERRAAAKIIIANDQEIEPKMSEEEIAQRELAISRIVSGAKFKSKNLPEDSADYREPIVESVEEHFYGKEGKDIVKVVTWNDARGKGHFIYTMDDFLGAFEMVDKTQIKDRAILFEQARTGDTVEIKKQAVREGRERLVYVEDYQGYYFTAIIFETEAGIPVEKMERVSREPIEAGMFSTSFKTFKRLMEEKGYHVQEIETFPKDTMPSQKLRIVRGATGNY